MCWRKLQNKYEVSRPTCHQQRELTLGKARYIDPDRLAVIAHMNLIRHGQEHIANFHSENTCRPALFHGDHDDV